MPKKVNNDFSSFTEEPQENQDQKKPKKFSFVPKMKKKAGYSQEERLA